MPVLSGPSAMCFFVVLVVAEERATQVVERFSAPDLSVEAANAKLFDGLPAGTAPLLVSGAGCACAWYRRPSSHSEEEREKARRRYAKRGWSATKIERALAQSTRKPRPDEGLHSVIVELALDVHAQAGPCGLLVHDYHGKVDRERVSVRSRSLVSMAELPARAAALDLDELFEIGG